MSRPTYADDVIKNALPELVGELIAVLKKAAEAEQKAFRARG